MNKFLYAMGISQWRLKARADAPTLLLLADDDQTLLQHPIVATVLAQLGIAPDTCQVTAHASAATPVLWCFGNAMPAEAMISTPTLAELQQSSQAKRALWQQLWPHLDGVQ
ncbi:DNA polymerase III subunit psi [Shewanella dokdonensis]|uniref:DNA polymerase III subunit psi n=1 Tax=Shewanella dokdonensis TaxID=712036 RepID=A0ABX8DE68_9GAMM|nr:DNA polymerase III subunit psi [Shewanella dokdonensis]MCL1073789.1 DNA polymerase III subunit psi [Shewanella dokdonensis]QVK22506.1 DNA polymerase III subunit psi [Shewanella dokdonensis]